MQYDTDYGGWQAIFKDYQETLFNKFLNGDPGYELSSREAWMYLNSPAGLEQMTRKSISRASVINWLNHMVEEHLLSYRETTGKGGHRRIYRLSMTKKQTENYVVVKFLSHIKRNFRRAFNDILPIAE